jgi:tRNA (adenine58-N1)-methyltransferase non-catalytic subunit
VNEIKSDRHKARLNKRKVVTDNLMSTREELFAGEFDGYNDIFDTTRLRADGYASLVIASEYDPWSIVETLFPYLAGSASIVVHSPYAQVRRVGFEAFTELTRMLKVLADLQSKMRLNAGFLGPSLTEAWLRRYQVLPGRTHPMMSTSGSGGFLLHVVKVYAESSSLFVKLTDRP